MELIEAAGRFADPGPDRAEHIEQLRRTDLSVGTYSLTYSLRVGAVDTQSPHTEDEVYVVMSGAGRFTGGDATVEVVPGTTLFVPAGEPHRFHDITADLAVLVFFGPAYGSRVPVSSEREAVLHR